MKIERPTPRLQKLLERSLETGDSAPLKAALEETQQTAPSELETFLSSVDSARRKELERLLGMDADRPAPATGAGGGQRIHDVRAHRQNPWWKGVTPDPSHPLASPIHPEPARDVEVHGEKFTKDDVASLLRSIGR